MKVGRLRWKNVLIAVQIEENLTVQNLSVHFCL